MPTVEEIAADMRRSMAMPGAPAGVEHAIAIGYITGLARPAAGTALARASAEDRLAAIRDVLDALDQVALDLADASTPDNAEWTTDQVLTYLADQGRPIAEKTWSGYVNRRQAPQPVRRIRRTPVWDPATIRAWHTGRRGQDWRAGQTGDQP